MKQTRTLDSSFVVRIATAGILALSVLQAAAAEPTTAAVASPDAAARAVWHTFMSRNAASGEGCFHASYPSYFWEKTDCQVAQPRAHTVRRAPQAGLPADVGNGNDYAASAAGLISEALGSFPSVTGVSDEQSVGVASFGGGGILGENEYTLQLNTNFTGTTATCARHTGCTVWQQFIYATDYQAQGQGAVFMQYWLIGWGNAACPRGWMSAGGGDCFRNSAIAAAPDIPITSLAQLSIFASATSGGNDSVVLSDAGQAFSLSARDNVVNIAQVWRQAEFNIIGDAGGSEAQFNGGSSVTVNLKLADGSSQAPQCLANSGTTGETNNLNLGACQTGAGTPQIQFTESN